MSYTADPLLGWKAPPKRIRTGAQLEKKRTRDRELQRKNRQNRQDRMGQIESELMMLHKKVDRLSSLLGRLSEPPRCSPYCDSLYPSLSSSRRPTQAEQPVELEQVGHQVPSVGLSLLGPSTSESQLVDVSHSDPLSAYHISHDPSYVAFGEGMVATTTAGSPAVTADFSGVFDLAPGNGFLDPQGLYESSVLVPHHTSWSPNGGPVADPGCFLSLDAQSLLSFRTSFGLESMRDGTRIFEQHWFRLLLDADTAISQDPRRVQQYPRSPSVANLLLIDVDSNPIVRVIGSMLRALIVPELVDSIAVYYIQYRFLRWRVYPVPDTYRDIPPWLRPSSLQKSRPHPISIDLIPWPGLRDRLIENLDMYEINSFSKDVADSLTVAWPINENILVKNPEGSVLSLAPKFEEHIWQLSNWRLTQAFASRYPEFSSLVYLADESST